MQHYRKWISRQYWLVGLLFSSLLVMLLFPSHLHLHHLDDIQINGGHHSHQVDLHFLTDIGTHAESTTGSTPLKNGPGSSMVKKFSDFSLDVVLLVVLLLLLPLTGIKITWNSRHYIVHPLRYFSLFPPLRAPPR